MDKVKERITIFLISTAILLVGFIIFRYVLFDMHGMKEWPFDLFVVGLILCLVGALLKGYFTCCFTVVGYILGFAIGINALEGTAGEASGWLFWLVVFVGLSVVGIVIDIFMKLRTKDGK